MSPRFIQRRLRLMARWLRFHLLRKECLMQFPPVSSTAALRAGLRRAARLELLGYEVNVLWPTWLIDRPGTPRRAGVFSQQPAKGRRRLRQILRHGVRA